MITRECCTAGNEADTTNGRQQFQVCLCCMMNFWGLMHALHNLQSHGCHWTLHWSCPPAGSLLHTEQGKATWPQPTCQMCLNAQRKIAMLQEQNDQVTASGLDQRMVSLESAVSTARQEAAAANSVSNNLQQRFAAMEWRIEQTASSCASTLRTMTAKHERMAGTIAVVKESANFAEAKCSALGSELARMHRHASRVTDIKGQPVL